MFSTFALKENNEDLWKTEAGSLKEKPKMADSSPHHCAGRSVIRVTC